MRCLSAPNASMIVELESETEGQASASGKGCISDDVLTVIKNLLKRAIKGQQYSFTEVAKVFIAGD